MTTEATLYDVRSGAAWITLNRPEARNALSAVLVSEVHQHLLAANEDSSVRSIIITGAEPAFCSGADLKNPPGQMIRGRQSVPYPKVLMTVMESPKPVIAAVNGAAFAGGLGLVGAADIVVAVEDAQFAFSEVRIGVIPAVISVVCIPKLGTHHAMRLFLTGERFTGAQAVEMGLAHRAVPKARFIEAVEEEISLINLADQTRYRSARSSCGGYRRFLSRTVSRWLRNGAVGCSHPRKQPKAWRRSGKNGTPLGLPTDTEQEQEFPQY